MKNCAGCGEMILLDQAVQPLPAPQRVRLGPKSGLPGLYPHEDFAGEEDQEEHLVHYPQCCMGYFNPEDNLYIYDAIVAEIREQLEKELRGELMEELRADIDNVRQMVERGEHNFCIECFKELQDDDQVSDEIQCIFCKQPDQVWTRVAKDGDIHYCSRCGKYWNQYEEEVAA